ncbi:MAG TPA: DUF4304 domain-containing protein [Candidatus Diapherotrites archaeon]|uniref:DUF4304 domain-containing protein n=1 Tax=Candidatus Iainarchaeum sp. TaxID=3101447 RepID=A0A7J4IZ42_9ARCH|nr:DUF4304 domain-containing protein [Candidatus Diapherotrites archaeon]
MEKTFRNGCLEIAPVFAKDGFKYFASKNQLTKKSKTFTYTIRFQSSHYNNAQHIQLIAHASVSSPIIKKWRENQPLHVIHGDGIAGGLVHLLTDSGFIEWNLREKGKKNQEIIRQIVGHISKNAFPYFSKFEDTVNLLSELKRNDIPAFGIGQALEFALCFGTKEDAQAIMENYLQRHPEDFNKAKKELEKYTTTGFPKTQMMYEAQQIAGAIIAYKLKPPKFPVESPTRA